MSVDEEEESSGRPRDGSGEVGALWMCTGADVGCEVGCMCGTGNAGCMSDSANSCSTPRRTKSSVVAEARSSGSIAYYYGLVLLERVCGLGNTSLTYPMLRVFSNSSRPRDLKLNRCW